MHQKQGIDLGNAFIKKKNCTKLSWNASNASELGHLEEDFSAETGVYSASSFSPNELNRDHRSRLNWEKGSMFFSPGPQRMLNENISKQWPYTVIPKNLVCEVVTKKNSVKFPQHSAKKKEKSPFPKTKRGLCLGGCFFVLFPLSLSLFLSLWAFLLDRSFSRRIFDFWFFFGSPKRLEHHWTAEERSYSLD